MLDASYILPFIQSTQNVFSMMLQMEVQVKDPHMKNNPGTSSDVTGIIGLSGDVGGSVCIGFPGETAIGVVEKFVGERMSLNDADFADAILEWGESTGHDLATADRRAERRAAERGNAETRSAAGLDQGETVESWITIYRSGS